MLKPVLGSQLQLGHPLARGLVGCWPINEGAGGVVADLSGNKNNGTITGANWVPGKYGSALDFNGVPDTIVIANSPELFSMSQLTLIIVAKYNGVERANEYNLIDAWDSGDTNYLLRFDDSSGQNKIGFYTDTSGGIAGGSFSNTDMSDNAEHHIVAVYDGSNMFVYFDGVKSPDSYAQTGSIDAGSTNIEIGGQVSDVNDLWIGLISHASILNRALSAAEIASLHRSPFQMFERRPIELITAAAASGGAVSETVEPATLQLALTQHAPSVIAGNDFSSDSDCKAVWDFESGASFIEDSKGGNDLWNVGADEDTTDYKQGACSTRFVRASADRMYIVDANLDSGFPLKSGETNKTVSFAFWLYLETTGVNQYLIRKTSASNYSIIIYVSSTNKIVLGWSSNGSAWDTANAHASALSASTWYHVTCTRDDSDNSYRIRIWDDTAQAILGIDKTGTGGNIYVGTGVVILGNNDADLAPDGNEDEVVVFDRALSVADIDAIRAGTYSGADATVTPPAFALALTQHTPSLSFFYTVFPATLELALAQQSPGLGFDYVISLGSALALALTLETPAIIPSVTVLPGSLLLSSTLLTPVVMFDFTAVPDPFSLALALEAPAILKNTLTWSAGLLTYKGITYEISAGVTQKRFVYWDPNYTTVFRDTDVLQDVFDADGWVMCLNELGVAYPAFARKLIHGGIIQAGTITAEYGQIAALTVGEAELKDLSVNSAKIGDLQVSSAKIADLTVGTGKITADAITKAAEDFDAAEQDCGSGTTNVAACSITLVTGGFVKIEASVTLAFDALNTTISVRVRRTGDSVDTLYLSNSIAWIGGGNASFAPLLSDSPGPGSYTYTLAVISTDANVHAYNACIIVQQFKK